MRSSGFLLLPVVGAVLLHAADAIAINTTSFSLGITIVVKFH